MYDNETTLHSDYAGLRVTNEMKRNWLSTSKWARFFAILGFVVSGLYLLFLGSVGTALEMISSLSGNPMLSMMLGPIMTYIMVFTGVVLLIQVAYHYYHLLFANNMRKALQSTDQTAFEQSWKNLRNHFRIFGIMIIVVIVCYVVGVGALVSMIGDAASGGEFPVMPTE